MLQRLRSLFAKAAAEEPSSEPPPAPAPPTEGTASFQILLDVPAEDPALDFDCYAEALSEIIQYSPPRFSIGLFGGWGSGKTTLMRAIEARLDTRRSIPVRFSAWRYEREEHLVIPLIDTIRQAIRNHGPGGKAALTAVNTLGGVVQSLIAGVGFKVGVPGALELSLDSGKALAEARRIEGEDVDMPGSLYFQSFTTMRQAFREFLQAVGPEETGSGDTPAPEPRFVVFVDDLDRCLPEGALTVLEAMKLFFDYHGFVFVVGLDREVVEAAITARYRVADMSGSGSDGGGTAIEGAEYVKKIFQVPFSLFPVAASDVDGFLEAITKGPPRLSADQLEELRTEVRKHLKYLVTDDGMNPREVKRYINSYTLIRKLKPKLEPKVVLALETINARPDWRIVREGLLGYRDVFIDRLRRQVRGDGEGDETALADLHPDLAAVPASFIDYVSPRRPGSALLKVSRIDPYIYAGEATRTSGGGRASDVIRKVSGLRKLIDQMAGDDAAAAKQARSELLSQVDHLQETLRELGTKVGSAFLRAATLRSDALHKQLQGPVPEREDPEEQAKARTEWTASAHEHVNEMVKDLMEWSRSV